jgi:PAS domain S-box-containing protein
MSFRSKIIWGMVLVVAVSGLLSALLVSRFAASALRTEIKKRGLSLALTLAARSADPILGQDFLRLKNVVDEVKDSSDDIVYAFMQDKSGQVLSHTFKGGFPTALRNANEAAEEVVPNVLLLDTGDDNIYDIALPAMIGQDRFGTVRVGLSRAKADVAVHRLIISITCVSLAVALLAMLMGTIFAGRVTRRLNILRQRTEDMVKETVDYLPETQPEYDGDEIQKLTGTFEFMNRSMKKYLAELKEAQTTLWRQQQLLQTILDVTPDVVSLLDEQLIFRAVNQAFCRYFSLSEPDVVGVSLDRLPPLCAMESHSEENQQVLATGLPISKEILVDQGQAPSWFHVVKLPIYNGDRITGLLITARDISDLKRYQEKLVQAVKIEELAKLAGSMAHEINTPLGIIQGYVQILLEDLPQDADSNEYLIIIEKQAHICRKLISDLLSFSGKLAVRQKRLDLNRSIQEVLQRVGPAFQQNQVEVRTRLAVDIPPLLGDHEKLQQVWLHLLNNAHESIGAHGLIWVTTELSPDRQRILVTVADTGAGISPENLPRIFDPLFTTKSPGLGTGLGLSLSYAIIQEHGGNIFALSPAPPEYLDPSMVAAFDPGPGAVFLIELPCRQPTESIA